MSHDLQREPAVAEVMTRDPVAIEPDATFATAVDAVDAYAIRHLPVVSGGRVVGVVSQRDLLAVRDPSTLVCDFMSTPALTVHPDTPARDAAQLLLTRKLGCAPVVTGDGELVGIVTEADFVRIAYAVLSAVHSSATTPRKAAKPRARRRARARQVSKR